MGPAIDEDEPAPRTTLKTQQRGKDGKNSMTPREESMENNIGQKRKRSPFLFRCRGKKRERNRSRGSSKRTEFTKN